MNDKGPEAPRSRERYGMRVDLNVSAIRAPTDRAAVLASNIIAAALVAFADDASLMPAETDMPYGVAGPAMTPDERRTAYQNWLFAKGFQDLAQGLRGSLEAAALYLALSDRALMKLAMPPGETDAMKVFNNYVTGLLRKSARLKFPELLSQVNAGLTSPLRFLDEVLSMRRVRNCFEYRAGVVGRSDLDDDGEALTLTFPTVVSHYVRDGEKVEFSSGEIIDTRGEPMELFLQVKRSPNTKRYKLGERISLTAKDFGEIAFGCTLFAQDLATKLPIVGKAPA